MRDQTTSIDMKLSREQLGRWLDRARKIGPAGPQLTQLVLRLADRPCREALAEARDAASGAARTAFWDVQVMAAALAIELEAALNNSAMPPSPASEPRSIREVT